MESIVNTHSRVMPDFARHSDTYVKPKEVRNLDDDFFISLTKEINAGLRKPSVSRKEVLKAINSGKISPFVVEELEDALFGVMMEEGLKEEGFVSHEEIMKILE